MKLTYLYKQRYYQRAIAPDKSGKILTTYREKEEGDRLWENSTPELFHQAQYYGKRVAKTISKTKQYQFKDHE